MKDYPLFTKFDIIDMFYFFVQSLLIMFCQFCGIQIVQILLILYLEIILATAVQSG